MTQKTNSRPDVREQAKPQPSLAQRIENLRLNESERQLASECLRDGELLGDLICRTEENLRSAATLVSSYFLHRAR